jgi:hypothetical protein
VSSTHDPYQTFDRLVVLRAVEFRESIEGGLDVLPGLGHGAPVWLRLANSSVEDVGSLVHPAALLARLGISSGFPRSRIEQEFFPRLRALAHTVDQTDQLLLILRRRADDQEQALRVILKAGLHVSSPKCEVGAYI